MGELSVKIPLGAYVEINLMAQPTVDHANAQTHSFYWTPSTDRGFPYHLRVGMSNLMTTPESHETRCARYSHQLFVELVWEHHVDAHIRW